MIDRSNGVVKGTGKQLFCCFLLSVFFLFVLTRSFSPICDWQLTECDKIIYLAFDRFMKKWNSCFLSFAGKVYFYSESYKLLTH